MSESDWFFDTRDDVGDKDSGSTIRLRLERYGARRRGLDLEGRRAVILLHGASANHRTFTIPNVGLADWLLNEGLDPWLLDWRGSSLVVEDENNREALQKSAQVFTLSHAAAEDLPAAIRRMRSVSKVQGPISLLGHCMGSAVIAEAVALHHLEGLDVDRVVLMALGLFYEAPIDSRLKSEERVLERLVTAAATTNAISIDPRLTDVPAAEAIGVATPLAVDDSAGSGKSEDALAAPPAISTVGARWPSEIQDLYDFWPQALQFHGADQADTVEALCNRISFMYGMPYHELNLIGAIHPERERLDDKADAHVQEEKRAAQEQRRRQLLEAQFGGIPLHLYLHCARNLRHGQATIATPGPSDRFVVSEEARSRFHRLDSVTLITGALNRLWHRDSIDRMHEWLTRGSSENRRRVHKHVLEDYAHQDLLWGSNSPADVYPKILNGVRRDPGTFTAGDPTRSTLE